jgi:hypothetical protein
LPNRGGRRNRSFECNNFNSTHRWWDDPCRRRGLLFLVVALFSRSRLSFRSSFSASPTGTTPLPFVLFGFFLLCARLGLFWTFFLAPTALLRAHALAAGNYPKAEIVHGFGGQHIKDFISDLACLFFS